MKGIISKISYSTSKLLFIPWKTRRSLITHKIQDGAQLHVCPHPAYGYKCYRCELIKTSSDFVINIASHNSAEILITVTGRELFKRTEETILQRRLISTTLSDTASKRISNILSKLSGRISFMNPIWRVKHNNGEDFKYLETGGNSAAPRNII